MAAAHQRLRFLPVHRSPTRRDRTVHRGRRTSLKRWRLADRVAARHIPASHDLAAVATDLLVAAALLERAFRAAIKDTDVNDVDVARALLIAGDRNRGRFRPSELAELLAVSPATVTRILDRAEAAGFIDRYYINTDRRSTLVYVTPAGERARREVLDHLRRAAAPMLLRHSDALARPLAAARNTWSPPPNGAYGRRFARDLARDLAREQRRSA
jgi:DNA-binding MarR family transcriptional regulator